VIVQSASFRFSQYRGNLVNIMAVQSVSWQFSQYRGSSVSIVAVQSVSWQFIQYLAVQSVSWPAERWMTKTPNLILSVTLVFSSS